MLIELLAVLEDGSTRAPEIPADVRKAITFPMGTDVTVRVRVVKPNGEVVTVPTNGLAFTVKKRPADEKVLQKIGPAAPASSVDFPIVPIDSSKLEAGYFVYDVWLTQAGPKRDAVVPLSPLYLSPTAG